MKKYSQFAEDDFKNPDFPWVKFKIIAETEEDKQELLKAFKHIHDSRDINLDYIVLNQLAHLYLDNPDDPCAIKVK